MAQARGELGIFLRRWLAHPLRVGAIAPSSRALGRLVARNAVSSPDDIVVELGAGTGTITHDLLAAGAREENLVLVELDTDLVAYLRRLYPRATILADDASTPAEIVPGELLGRAATVISGIPALQFSDAKQRSYIGQCIQCLREGGQILQYTYSLKSPIRQRETGVTGQRLGVALVNVPPAHVWGYTPAVEAEPAAAAE
ncbi:phosphatidylethanolamine/phosphatidyl-N-methylethanolamine N-methyltransferase [Limimonas halophila]|uniref:Phosphatidylethanolamine/phosphatidyl-N-methylethanolamine N-methyltransferase n=1 Tax=Limimonas halophila TaxID=1082479 RepID=A0A1G7V836_9PROT|nr:rRNA adenine N-6-methyltransferase family protein [Limimonas halophila]SDG55877.1 phosphatidylethanolamine/phosphatidyl-N-methylethanolamine N-methyltransferase [Limimonas halophila]